ncbi:MAG: hemerythrin family protein [Desulfobulbaceae bacterium]|nr:hemerythrin family protein [Desulfobulbaceae bacterium]
MTTPAWKNEYAVGIEDIDHQHQYFFLLIQRLQNLFAKGSEPRFISNLIDELVKYAVFHFKSEENIMEYRAYPHLMEHRIKHIRLIEELNIEKIRYDCGTTDSVALVAFLERWFTSHTTTEDAKFGNFVRELCQKG